MKPGRIMQMPDGTRYEEHGIPEQDAILEAAGAVPVPDPEIYRPKKGVKK